MSEYHCKQRGCRFEYNGNGKPKKCAVCKNPMVYVEDVVEEPRRYFVDSGGEQLYSTTDSKEAEIAVANGFTEIDAERFAQLYTGPTE